MLTTLAIRGYRSVHELVMPLSNITVITGENGTGKSNLYRALRLLANAANGEVAEALAMQGGLSSALWAGPENISKAMESGDVPVQGGPRQKPVRLCLGFASDHYGYQIQMGLPRPDITTLFNLDPEIKRECIWHGSMWRQAAALIDRKGPLLKRRRERKWETVSQHLNSFDTLFQGAGTPTEVPELFSLRSSIQNWRFYADFRTDAEAPARQSRPATRTPILHHDGRDLPAALQTIAEIGNADALSNAIEDAFPGSQLVIDSPQPGLLSVSLRQPGLLRELSCKEWSDGTLQYVLLVAALLSPRPPELMVLNEPESSLHPDLLGALARLIENAAERSQIWVVSHSQRLVNALEAAPESTSFVLTKNLGRTAIAGQHPLDKPSWRWAGA